MHTALRSPAAQGADRIVNGRRGRRALCIAAAMLGTAACGAERSTAPAPDLLLEAVEIANGLASPVYLTAPPGDDRLFIVEQIGRVRIIRGGVLLPRPFLDITSRVLAGGERGLLSIAFHPAFSTNGFVYVSYTAQAGGNRVERYTVRAGDADALDPASGQLVLSVAQQYTNHNGGLIAFGPDGKLYVGKGDGGGAGDPDGNAQNKATLLGKILRLDVDGALPYEIPADNPFVGESGSRAEIWALGLRNPWRFAFDRVAGTLYVADVGQSAWEEVHVVPADRPAVNYGWSVMEGNHCFTTPTCNSSPFDRPVLEYSHGEGCSITGGYVYRGARVPGIQGHYFYSDYCSGFVRSFRYDNGAAIDRRHWGVGDVGSVLSFGEDAAGELYVLSANGRVYRLDAR